MDLPAPDSEGGVKTVQTTVRERSARNRQIAIMHHGLTCQVCGFNFQAVYGELGKDFIEVHHLNQLSETEGPVEVDPVTDLACVCSNCHRMLHRRRRDSVGLEELKNIVRKGGPNG